MKHFKYMVFFILLITNCKNNFPYYDIDAPKIQYRCFLDDTVLFQFNEPIKNLYFFTENQNSKKTRKIDFSQPFPVANFFIDLKDFTYFEEKILYVYSKDMWDNVTIDKIAKPIYNKKPALIKFDRLRLHYSKKKKQMLILKVMRQGNTNGYNFIYYSHGKKILTPFADMKVENSDSILIYMNKSDKKKQVQRITNNSTFLSNGRFSSVYSLIYIEDNKENIMDYIFYYNLKKHNKQYYLNNKTFSRMIKDLQRHEIDDFNITDINGTTTKKLLIKHKDKWYIKSEK